MLRNLALSSASEAQALLDREPTLTPIQRAIQIMQLSGKTTLHIADRIINSINALAIAEAISMPFMAYPREFELADRIVSPIGLPLCFAQIASEIAKEKKFTYQIAGFSISAEKVHDLFSGLINSTNTFYFFFGALIAVFIAADIALTQIGFKVDVSNLAYMLGFILPSIIIALAHAVLEFNKEKFQNSDSTADKIVRFVHHVLSSLYNSSNLFSFLVLGLSQIGVNGVYGSVNPYDRLGLFTDSLMAGTFLAIVSANKKELALPIAKLINTICAMTYVLGSINASAKKDLGDTLRNIFIAGFSGIALSAIVAQLFFAPPPNRTQVRIPAHNIQDLETPTEPLIHSASLIPRRQSITGISMFTTVVASQHDFPAIEIQDITEPQTAVIAKQNLETTSAATHSK